MLQDPAKRFNIKLRGATFLIAFKLHATSCNACCTLQHGWPNDATLGRQQMLHPNVASFGWDFKQLTFVKVSLVIVILMISLSSNRLQCHRTMVEVPINLLGRLRQIQRNQSKSPLRSHQNPLLLLHLKKDPRLLRQKRRQLKSLQKQAQETKVTYCSGYWFVWLFCSLFCCCVSVVCFAGFEGKIVVFCPTLTYNCRLEKLCDKPIVQWQQRLIVAHTLFSYKDNLYKKRQAEIWVRMFCYLRNYLR